MSPQGPSVCFLFDNGSLRPEATLGLRALARALSARLSHEVRPVSLLHSSNVPAEALGGTPAGLLEPSLAAYFEQNPDGRAVLIPLFFGPSAALTDYVPARIKALRERFPGCLIAVCRWLVDVGEPDRRLAEILADRVRGVMQAADLRRPAVVLVDHGSPQPAVAEVRNCLGRLMRAELGDSIAGLAVASMERREGDAYAFNDPLLAAALRRPGFDRGNVIIALQFLSPGRHAGAGGDIAEICMAAEAESAELKTWMTEPIISDVRLVELLAERFAQAVEV